MLIYSVHVGNSGGYFTFSCYFLYLEIFKFVLLFHKREFASYMEHFYKYPVSLWKTEEVSVFVIEKLVPLCLFELSKFEKTSTTLGCRQAEHAGPDHDTTKMLLWNDPSVDQKAQTWLIKDVTLHCGSFIAALESHTLRNEIAMLFISHIFFAYILITNNCLHTK